MQPKTIKGYTYAVLSSSTFGLAPLFTLLLIGSGLNSFEVLFYRWGTAALTLGVFGLLAGYNFRINKRDIGVICMLGFVRAMTSLSLVIAYQDIATSIASAIHFVYPLAVACGMGLFFKERISMRTRMAIAVSLVGAILLSLKDLSSGNSNAVVGIVTAVTSVLFYGTYMIGVRKTRAADIDSAAFSFYVTLFGAVLFALCSIVFNGKISIVTEPEIWLFILGIGIVATAISNITLINAIKYIGPTLTSLFGAMEPLTALAVGVLVLGEQFTLAMGIGILLVITAVSSVMMPGRNKKLPESQTQ